MSDENKASVPTGSASRRRRACRYGKNGYFGICTCDECRKIIIVTDEMRLKWLHTGGGRDAEGYEWGIFRVKWDERGQPVSVLQTLSDMSDLDAEIRRERLAELNTAPPPTQSAVPARVTGEK
jgi:hypothetical protein